MCTKILKNLSWHCPISNTEIERLNKVLYTLVDSAYSNGAITKTDWEFIRTEYPRTPTYALPKRQRNISPTGWPITLGNGYLKFR